MCELCRHNPCSPNCPNAPEPEPVYICDNCEEGIYPGDEVYEIDGKYYCETCIDNAGYIAEAPEEPEIDAMDVYKAYIEREMCDEL